MKTIDDLFEDTYSVKETTLQTRIYRRMIESALEDYAKIWKEIPRMDTLPISIKSEIPNYEKLEYIQDKFNLSDEVIDDYLNSHSIEEFRKKYYSK